MNGPGRTVCVSAFPEPSLDQGHLVKEREGNRSKKAVMEEEGKGRGTQRDTENGRWGEAGSR